MEKSKTFPLIFAIAAIFIAVVGVLVFSFGGVKSNKSKDTGPTVIIWGTEDATAINDVINKANNSNQLVVNAKYVQEDPASFNQDLLEALATGNGPDVILTSAEDILTYKNKIQPIPYTAISQENFKNTFIQEGELLMNDSGLLGVPFSVDPLVLYWNRDIFTANNIPSPPTTWGQVLTLVPSLNNVSNDLTVNKASISLGGYNNIQNAKRVLSALMLQAGTPITSVVYDNVNKKLSISSELSTQNNGAILLPAVSALDFYTQFGNPTSKEYTWNSSLPNSLDYFTSNNLAMYIGYGSDDKTISAKNPNLNFDMTLLPQTGISPVPITYGNMDALAILSSSKNKTGALNAIDAMTSAIFLKAYSDESGLPPVRRDLLASAPGDSVSGVLYRSALYSKGFLDPDSTQTNSVFQGAVQSVLSSLKTSSQAITDADAKFGLEIQNFNNNQ